MRWLVPVLVFVAVRIVLIAAAAHGAPGASAWDAGTWARWDAGIYLWIAERGYELFPCPEAGTDWCGNAGWLPGYPYAMALARLGGRFPAAATGAVISALCSLAASTFFWFVLLDRRPVKITAGHVAALVLFTTAFGAVYQHAIFPVSMFLLCAVSQGALLIRRQFLWAGLVGAIGAFTYSTGFLLAIPAAVCAATASDYTTRQRLVAAATAGGLTLLGFVAVLALHHQQLGAWDAFFRVQQKYGHGPSNPFSTWWHSAQPFFTSANADARVVAFHTLFVTASMALILVALVRARPRRAWAPEDVWAAAYAIPFWLFPLLMGQGVSLVRADALLAPAVLALRHYPVPAVVLWALAGAVLFFPMSVLYFTSSLM